MDARSFKEKAVQTVEIPMLELIKEDEDCGYTEKDVKKCIKILSDYIDMLAAEKGPNDVMIMKAVKKTVLALNSLNEKTDYALIETGEREAVWEIMQSAAVASGLSEPPGDVTEEWREW